MLYARIVAPSGRPTSAHWAIRRLHELCEARVLVRCDGRAESMRREDRQPLGSPIHDP